MADAPKLLGTDTLRTAYPKVNMAIDNANEALRNSEDALDKATQALDNSENTQAQLDQIVIEGDSSVEAAQARVDADGNVFTTLKERLDTKETQFANEIGNLSTNKADLSYVDNQLSLKRDKSTKITNADLDISSDANKIKLVNLSDEVLQAMAGTTPVNATPGVNSVTTEKIAPEAVTYKKIKTAKPGKNLFDKSTAIYGYYVSDKDGQLKPHIDPWLFYASDYIEIEPNTQYVRPDIEPLAFYDSDKNFISGGRLSNPFTTPSNAKYVRVSVPVEKIDTYQLEKGTVATEYEPFGYKISKDVLEIPPASDFFKLLLPDEFCVAVGRTLEIYNKQICHTGNIHNYHFNYVSNIGVQMGRKWTFTPSESQIGSYGLTVNVYDNNLNLVETASTTIKVVNKSTDITPKKVLAIGDSLTDIDYWRKELKSLVDSTFGTDKLLYIGTKGTAPYLHEGMSGWKTESFLQNTNYTYGGNIILNVSGVTIEPTSKKQYIVPDNQGGHIWEVEKVIKDESGNITQIYMNRTVNGTYTINPSGTINQVDGSTIGQASITYTSWQWQPGNPFWNTETNQLDFNYYLTKNNFEQPDLVTIFLGANDLGSYTGKYDALKTYYQTSVNNLKTIVDKILTQWTGTKIFVILTPFWANQDGLGKNYGSAADKFEIQQHLKVFTLIEMINEQFRNYHSDVKVVPVAQTMDSEYAYTPQTVTVNPRSSITTTVQTGGVHPSQEGFLQIADIIFSHFVSVFNG